MTRFWLVRHGEPVAEARQRCYGSLDVALAETGRRQIAQVAEYLRREPIAAIYSSPLSRALEGARILADTKACQLEVVPDFREIHFGDFEGLTYDELAARYPDLYREWMEKPTEVRFPSGESYVEMRVRVLSAFETIRREREGQTVLIHSHGGVNRILLSWALQIPDDCIFRLKQSYAAINLLTVMEDGTPVVDLMNSRAGRGDGGP